MGAEASPPDPLTDFLRAATAPVDGWHGGGTLAEAEAIRAAHPEVATASIHAAAALGDPAAVIAFLVAEPSSATGKGGVHGWDPLTYLAFSRYLRLELARGEAFVEAARALLDAGASPNTGFLSPGHQAEPELVTVLYGAAGVAHHAGLTRILLERGADPNDGETAYHAPETLDDSALQLIVESGRLDAEGITTMLHRKLDWHHFDGVAWLVEHGADPNRPNHPWRCGSALHHALSRGCSLRYFERLLDRGGDPNRPPAYGDSAPELAARLGRADVLDLFLRRGFPHDLSGNAAFFEACARGDEAQARGFLVAEPTAVARFRREHSTLVTDFAGAGNTAGTRLLLDLGFDLAGAGPDGGAATETPLHVAIWHERLETVRLLIARGAPLEARDHRGDTPLELAVRALRERSEWTPHESTALVVELLEAGARVESVRSYPSGSAQADALLRRYGRM
jgi:ankyrin repeat protein